MNGDEAFHVGELTGVGTKPFPEESLNVLGETVLSNNFVPDTTVNGAVGAVKLVVYKAVPTTYLKLDVYPAL